MTITSIVEMLVQENASIEKLAAAIGPITEKERHRYRLAPTDPSFREARIGFESTDGKEKPRYIDLLLSQDLTLRIADLAEEFGTADDTVPPPSGNPYQVRFRFDKPHLPYLAFIYAYLTGPPNESSTSVESLTIRREERI